MYCWLRHCATSREVAGSTPGGVIGIFHWHNPSGRIMALGLTQPLTEISTRNISWGVKAAGAWGWQPCHLLVLILLRSGSLSLLEHSDPVQASNGIALPFTVTMHCRNWTPEAEWTCHILKRESHKKILVIVEEVLWNPACTDFSVIQLVLDNAMASPSEITFNGRCPSASSVLSIKCIFTTHIVVRSGHT